MINELPIALTSNPNKQIEILTTTDIFTEQLYSIFSKIAIGELLNTNASRTDGEGPFFVGEPVGEMLRNLSQQRVSNLGFRSSSRHSSGFFRNKKPLFTNNDKEVSVFRSASLASDASNVIAFINHIKTFLELKNFTGPLTTQAQLEQVEVCLQEMLINLIYKDVITNASYGYGSLTIIPSVIHNNSLVVENHQIWFLDFFIYFHTETKNGTILTIISSRSNFMAPMVFPYQRNNRFYEISIKGAINVSGKRSEMYHAFFGPPLVGREDEYSTYCECLGYVNIPWNIFRDGSRVSYRFWCVKKEKEKDSKIKKESSKISADDWARLFQNIPLIQKHFQEAVKRVAEKKQTKHFPAKPTPT